MRIIVFSFVEVKVKKHKIKLSITVIGFVLSFLTIATYSQNPLDSLGYNYLEEIFAKVTDPEKATAIYYQALKNLEKPSPQNEERIKRLEAEVTDIMIETERAVYENLKTSAEKVAFFYRFWLVRDLTPATEANERLVEHYARLARARKKFSFPGARGYDDRGSIYVQYGPPDIPPEIEWLDVETPESFSFFLDMEKSLDLDKEKSQSFYGPPLTWVYFNPRVSFYFIEKGYGYRLTMPPFHTRVPLQNRPMNLPQGMAFSNILKEVSKLPFAVHIARFKEDAQRQSLAVTYGLKSPDLKFTKEDSTVGLILAAAVKDTNLLILASEQDTLHLASSSFDGTGELIGALQYTISPGHYVVALDFNNFANHQRGLKDFSITVGNYPTGRLHLSSVIFAKEVHPVLKMASTERQPITPSLVRHDLEIKPYPFAALKRNTTILIYFEIYDLKRDAAGETFYEVEYEVYEPAKKGFSSFLASLNPFGKPGGSISVSETRRGNAAMEPTYLQLDFSQLRNGKHNLIVRVTDKLAKINKESKLEFELE